MPDQVLFEMNGCGVPGDDELERMASLKDPAVVVPVCRIVGTMLVELRLIRRALERLDIRSDRHE